MSKAEILNQRESMPKVKLFLYSLFFESPAQWAAALETALPQTATETPLPQGLTPEKYQQLNASVSILAQSIREPVILEFSDHTVWFDTLGEWFDTHMKWYDQPTEEEQREKIQAIENRIKCLPNTEYLTKSILLPKYLKLISGMIGQPFKLNGIAYDAQGKRIKTN